MNEMIFNKEQFESMNYTESGVQGRDSRSLSNSMSLYQKQKFNIGEIPSKNLDKFESRDFDIPEEGAFKKK
jgi:hypothetical protein